MRGQSRGAMKKEYAPKPRIVVEISKPRILGIYVNGEKTDIPATLEYSESRYGRPNVNVTFIEDSHPLIEGMGVGSAPDIEIEFADEPT